MKKGLLPTDWYHLVVRQSTLEDNVLRLVWTVDAGPKEFLWRNIVQNFDMNKKFDVERLHLSIQPLNFMPYPKEHPEFAESFLGLRSRVKIERRQKGSYMVNFIAEHQLPEVPPQIDPLEEKTDEHFFHTEGMRNLPL